MTEKERIYRISEVARALGISTVWPRNGDTIVLLAGSAALEWLVYPVRVLAVLVGFALYSAATLQARVLPRWCSVGLIVGLPVAIALRLYGGNILFGLLWLALGYVLWSRGEAATEQPSRVS